ncbi:MAG: HI0074 family nucleotidyltransferase substrate-binding subunit [bacterium]|nr:HI0074 family nucleotidyltransferase substrate-binding subunit [bacterium]
MPLDLTSLEQAHRTLAKALVLCERATDPEEKELLRDGAIQRFEYTYELAWKLIQRWLADVTSPEATEPVFSRKELFRQAARLGLIEDPSAWFALHQARNVSAHTYNVKHAALAFEAATELVEAVSQLLEKLRQIHD